MQKKYLAIAATISLLAFSNAFATEYVVTTEAELTAANTAATSSDTIRINGDITLTGNIVLNASISLTDSIYTITGGGYEITTTNGAFSIPDNVTVNNLVIDNITTYANNSKTGNGGAIEYDAVNPVSITGGAKFTGNSATVDGGAISNNNATSAFIIDGGAIFTDNNTIDDGGAIYNYGSEFTINGGAVFTNNSIYDPTDVNSSFGGAIANYYGSVFTINGDVTFKNNSANSSYSWGGAIINLYSTFVINNKAFFINNSATHGGAINNHNNDSIFTINDDVTFIGNSSVYQGGAIFNTFNTNFTINGKATFINNNSGGIGGAIENSNGSTFIFNDTAIFEGNYAEDWGGAIYNYNADTILTINDGAFFSNNTAAEKGGAIFIRMNPTVNLIARTSDVTFTGNTANGVDNAVHIWDNSTMNLNASDIAKVIFNDGITSEGNSNIIRINATSAEDAKIPADVPTTGEIILNADMSGFGNHSGATGNTVGLYGGTLSLGANGVFFDSVDFIAASGSTLNLINNKIDAISFNTADINNMNLNIDVDLELNKADTLNATALGANNDIKLTGLSLIKEGTSASSTVTIDPDDEFDITLASSATKVSGQVYDYSVSNNGDGTLSFNRSTINPVVQASSATQQAATLNIANTNNVVFNRADDVMNIMDSIQNQTGIDYRFVNKVAALEGQAEYSKLYGRLQEGSVWFRPFSSIEEISVDNMSGKVDSVSYGALVGIDSPLYNLGKGRRGMLSIYGGYSGASQDYADVDLYQNGGMFGVMGALYKGNFYTSLSTNVGGYGVVENIDNYGSANYSLFTTSVASKTGYNWHLPKQTVLQLNNQLAYNLVVTQDYNNAMGTSIKTDPLHAIQIIPGVKLSKNINGWQPYLSASVTFNALNESKVTANDVVLPDSSLGSYVEYGVGVQNYNDKGPGGFAQVMVRNGSRTGVAFKFGLKAPIGKKEKLDTL